MQMLALRPLSALRRSLALSEIGYVAVVLAVLTGAVIDDGGHLAWYLLLSALLFPMSLGPLPVLLLAVPDLPSQALQGIAAFAGVLVLALANVYWSRVIRRSIRRRRSG